MELELEKGLELFKILFLKQTITHPLVFSVLLLHFTSDAQRTFVALQVACPMTQKSLGLGKE
jgi:hypothetical protein